MNAQLIQVVYGPARVPQRSKIQPKDQKDKDRHAQGLGLLFVETIVEIDHHKRVKRTGNAQRLPDALGRNSSNFRQASRCRQQVHATRMSRQGTLEYHPVYSRRVQAEIGKGMSRFQVKKRSQVS